MARHYLDILTGAFMVRQLLPWFENTGKRLVKAPKVYSRSFSLTKVANLCTTFPAKGIVIVEKQSHLADFIARDASQTKVRAGATNKLPQWERRFSGTQGQNLRRKFSDVSM